MSSKITGSNQAFRYRIENEFDEQYGDVFIEYWNGPKSPILSLANSFKAAGYKVQTTHVGPKYEMVVRIASGTSDSAGSIVETPVDQWSIDMEPAQVSIWQHPSVDEQMQKLKNLPDGTFLPTVNRALYRKDIEDAISEGTILPYPLYEDAVARGLYNMLLRGVDSYEIKRPVLTKTRTFSTTYAARFTLDQQERVYTTTALIRDMSVPVAIQRQLPTNPTAVPESCAWSWKVRTDRSKLIPALGKIEETRDWVFDAWPVDQGIGFVWGPYQLIG